VSCRLLRLRRNSIRKQISYRSARGMATLVTFVAVLLLSIAGMTQVDPSFDYRGPADPHSGSIPLVCLFDFNPGGESGRLEKRLAAAVNDNDSVVALEQTARGSRVRLQLRQHRSEPLPHHTFCLQMIRLQRRTCISKLSKQCDRIYPPIGTARLGERQERVMTHATHLKVKRLSKGLSPRRASTRPRTSRAEKAAR
jgi:hypothetical protein